MGYSLQEDNKPRKEIWLWLGFRRFHSYTNLQIRTIAHPVAYNNTFSHLLLIFAVMSRQALRLTKPYIQWVTGAHFGG